MPLTAFDVTGQTVDATVCDDATWLTLHKVRPRVLMVCRDCGKPMHAKVSSNGLRFFAHDARADNCSSLGETPAHLALKRLLATLIRDAGGTAILEATPSDTDQGGWRADVLGIGTGGRRIAFEAQLAAMTVEDGLERTARYAADGIDTVWVSHKHAPWMCRLPSCRLLPASEPPTVDRGIARYTNDHMERWEPAEPIPLIKVVGGLLHWQVTTTLVGLYREEVAGKSRWGTQMTLLATVQDAKKEAADRRAAEDERRRWEAEEATHRAAVLALEERQERVLQLAVLDAIDAATATATLWLGVPPKPWTGELPVPLSAARRKEGTGYAPAVWIGDELNTRRLWAVVCPPANQVTPGLGRSWRKRDVRVYVETEKEARDVGKAIQWPSRWLLIRPAVTEPQPG